MHSTINSVDHLSNLNKTKLLDISLHRTKCVNIIKNLIGPHFLKDLLNDIHGGNYSLIIDESTDVTTQKMLGLVISYCSTSMKKIVCTFLALVHIEDGTAKTIVVAIKKVLQNVNCL